MYDARRRNNEESLQSIIVTENSLYFNEVSLVCDH